MTNCNCYFEINIEIYEKVIIMIDKLTKKTIQEKIKNKKKFSLFGFECFLYKNKEYMK